MTTTAQAQWTPRPIHQMHGGAGYFGDVRIGAEGRSITVYGDSLAATRERQALVCAAPDLLAALTFIVNDAPEGEDARLTAKGYNLACSAIAAAKGK